MRLVFFLSVLAVLLTGLSYVMWHVWALLPFGKCVKAIIVAALVAAVLSLLYFRGDRLDNMPLNLAVVAYEISTSGLFILLYGVMTFLVLDILTLCRVLPRAWLHHNGWTALAIVAVLTAIFVGGNIHYHKKYRKTIALHTEKPIAKPMKIVMVSDLHLGYNNRRAVFAQWVDMLNEEHADLILVAGDILDVSARPLIEERTAEEFKRLNAPVYACLGNHEYYSQEAKARKFYADAGITLLRDDSLLLDNGLCIVGRDDRTNRNRKSLRDILPDGAPKDRFTVLLDHQPYHLEEAENLGVDLQLSGHTHYGQVWPISWITSAIYEITYGEGRRGSTFYYVSSGLGIWGGKYRIGTKSEYVVIEID